MPPQLRRSDAGPHNAGTHNDALEDARNRPGEFVPERSIAGTANVRHAKRTIGGDSVDLCDMGKDGSAPPLPILRYCAILLATAGDCCAYRNPIPLGQKTETAYKTVSYPRSE